MAFPASGPASPGAADRAPRANGDPMLAARFAVPPIPPTLVHRPRLIRGLAEAVQDCPLVLVTGPAGAGKTLLAADWLATEPPPGAVAWLTAEDGDDAVGTFWAYLLEALTRGGVPPPDGITGPVHPLQLDPSFLARLAAHLSRAEQPVVVVLDEFERVTSTEVAQGLHTLLRHAAPNLRLVLVSRTEPQLPLHRYWAAGQAAAVRAADLAFRPDEAAALLERHGLTLTGEAVQALTTRTEGWAAGLRLAALAAQQAKDAETFLRDFEAGHSTVADFLTAEVLGTQPPTTQDLLLRTSVLDRTHPDLADALTGRHDATAVLADLARANAFIEPLDHCWYRFHPLFAEILRVRLRVCRPGLERELHSRAARWLCASGRLAEALPHAEAAGDWEFAAAEFVEHLAVGELFAGRDADRLARLFDRMPTDASGPSAELVRAALRLLRRDVDGGIRHLLLAEQQLHACHPDTDGTDAARLTYAHLQVLAGRLLGSAQLARAAALEAAELARRVPAPLLAAHPELPALQLNDLGATLLWEGRFAEATAALSAAVARTGTAPDADAVNRSAADWLRHETLSRLALTDYLAGRLSSADAHARDGRSQAERSGLPTSMTGLEQLVTAAVAVDRDELPQARLALQRAAESTAADQDPIMRVELPLVRSRLLLTSGHPEAALDVLAESAGTPPSGERPVWVESRVAAATAEALLAAGEPAAAAEVLQETGADSPQCTVATARTRLASGDSQEALRTLDALPAAEAGPAIQAEAALVRACAAAESGDHLSAQRFVGRALETARPERFRRPFREAGPWLRHVLRARPDLARSHDWLPADLRAAAVPGPGAPGARSAPAALIETAAFVEPLTGRELEVLARAADMMSTMEIAADLHVSVNTVKSHLKSVNRKLCASRRREAVLRARELHLL